MSDTFARIKALVVEGWYESSLHALRELAVDGIVITPLIGSIADAVVVEDYPDYHKGPSVLVLQHDEFGRPIHLVWGYPETNLDLPFL